MTSMGRLELLLMRVHDGVATPEEHAEFEALGGADAARAWDSMRAQIVGALAGSVDVADEVIEGIQPPAWGGDLRDAVTAPRVDVADDVMAFLEEPGWAPALRDAVSPPVDLADAVFADLEAMDRMVFADGALDPEAHRAAAAVYLRDPAARAALQAQAELGGALREAVAGEVAVWDGVARAIGAEVDAEEALPGWDETAAGLRAAIAAAPAVDVAGAVMARVAPTPRARIPSWASLGAPVGLLAAAAAVFLALVLGTPTPDSLTTDVRRSVGLDLSLAAVNDAQVEELQTAGDVVAQVVQFDDGGPTFIILDDPDGLHDVDPSGAPL